MGRILVTGATGFVGNAMVPALIAAGWEVRASGRDPSRKPANCEFVAADLALESDLDSLVANTDAILHLAARVPVMHEKANDPLWEFRRANVAPTARLVEAPVRNKVKHFTFASSLKVHGEKSGDQPFREDDPLLAEDAYGVSKAEAERVVAEQAVNSGISATILRLPLMYGPGVKGNFLRLARIVATGLPLPFAAVTNRRSMLYVGNFCSAVLADLDQTAAGVRTFLLSDGHDVSTAELVRNIAAILGRPARLFPVPESMLQFVASLIGYSEEIRRLTESLQVDISRVREVLHWIPPHSFDEGVAQTIRAMAVETAKKGPA